MVVNSAGQLGRVAEESVEPYGARACACAEYVRARERTAVMGARHWASDVLGRRDLSHRRFDDGDVLFRRSAADSDAGDHLVVAGERHAAAHGGVSTAGDGE